MSLLNVEPIYIRLHSEDIQKWFTKTLFSSCSFTTVFSCCMWIIQKYKEKLNSIVHLACLWFLVGVSIEYHQLQSCIIHIEISIIFVFILESQSIKPILFSHYATLKNNILWLSFAIQDTHFEFMSNHSHSYTVEM